MGGENTEYGADQIQTEYSIPFLPVRSDKC